MLAMLMTVEVGGHVDIVSVDVDVVMFSTVTCCSGARTQERKARGGGASMKGVGRHSKKQSQEFMNQ